MKKMKKALAMLMVLTMVCAMFAACGTKNANSNKIASTSGGKIFRIYCWNTEFQDRFNEYYASKIPADVKVEWVINPNEDNVYQTKLDEALQKQESAAPEDRIDLFLIEADYALKYVGTDYTLNVIKDVGLTEKDLSQQYQYTKDVVTSNGALKGVSWQSCPMGFLYRRSMAKAVLGTDDPDQVQEMLSDWTKFDDVAAKMKAAGNFMLSGYDDDYRVFANNKKQPWVDSNKKIVIDDQIKQWVSQTKTYTDKGYNNKASLWSAESTAQMANDGKVFGYFGPGWFMDFCFMSYTLDDPNGEKEIGNGGFGDWAMCKGPQGSYWGGTWICGAAGTDNLDIVKDIMLTMTCNKDTLVKITNKFGDFTNSVAAMEEIANSDYGYPFLGGQNHIKVLLDSAQDIHISAASPFDQTMTEKLQLSMKDYFEGVITEQQAWDNFYTEVLGKHPELSK
ncbi:MAG TPA: ABC transporter substrate-binding protein [Lachnoclostridium phytofermentans]|uniref:ABC transporter substrate-binding protein n=1 Tax=Lachnoclostridium phytofermentans TaxID=66219 RepID=A0A3D2X5I4_9FIRM|nr:ABC transporter substrate-binding protein [Lachnoclostridium sp.]HCL02399.1 ABC transporter substrate-binding protein [Lachnoclostridium phytofermentans]